MPRQRTRITRGQRRLRREEVSIHREIQHIVERALAHVVRIVTLGSLMFFSTDTGDAWMLDQDDGLALRLARDGEQLPARIVETPEKFAIEWTHDYLIEGDLFVVTEKAAGRPGVRWPSSPATRLVRSCRGFVDKQIGRGLGRSGISYVPNEARR